MTVGLGLNRWDWRSVEHFSASVARAESVGIDYSFQPVNPLLAQDPYQLLASAASRTSRIRLGPLLETPVLRPPAVAAGSIATLDEISGGRAMLTYGVGDTAVRMLGLRPARVAELEAATAQARALLAGEPVEVGARAPAKLRHARPVPVWVAAGGPRSLRAAGRVADGVFLRVGTHPANVAHAVSQVQAGVADAGRSNDDVRIGLIVHTIRSQDPSEIGAISRAMAAGFYEYSPALFDPPGFAWNGPPIHDLQAQVYPDFHHAGDLVAAGDVVRFLPDEIAESFSFFGTADDIADRIGAITDAVPQLDVVVPHPVPLPTRDALGDYMDWLGTDLRAALR